MTKIRRTQAREGAGVRGLNGDGKGRGGDRPKDRPVAVAAVMPLWDRPRPVVCR
ncbi:hypothetical protein HMPREF1211_04793 [Streptomyces sp. HGB0020]|jgi:hypothetical protein|nr:hypothetical protein HMPREF1211_04793 [Streptomyces sp. HGB0020]